MKEMKRKKKGFVGIVIFLAVFAASSAVVMLLWNWLIPHIIGWTVINFWQAAGLVLLCRLLFSNFHNKGHFMGAAGAHHHRKMTWEERERMRDAVKDMSYEQRMEYMRKHMAGMHYRGPEKP